MARHTAAAAAAAAEDELNSGFETDPLVALPTFELLALVEFGDDERRAEGEIFPLLFEAAAAAACM